MLLEYFKQALVYRRGLQQVFYHLISMQLGIEAAIFPLDPLEPTVWQN